MEKRKKFTREFKLEAESLLEEDKKPADEPARELGVRQNQLYKRKEVIEQKGNDAFPGHDRRVGAVSLKTEIARLKHELSKAKEEVEILKKAAAFSAKKLQ